MSYHEIRTQTSARWIKIQYTLCISTEPISWKSKDLLWYAIQHYKFCSVKAQQQTKYVVCIALWQLDQKIYVVSFQIRLKLSLIQPFNNMEVEYFTTMLRVDRNFYILSLKCCSSLLSSLLSSLMSSLLSSLQSSFLSSLLLIICSSNLPKASIQNFIDNRW